MVPEAAVTTLPGQPNWRDEPEALDRLCDAGARQLHGPDRERRDIRTLNPPEEYL
jgi:hypothetical protein